MNTQGADGGSAKEGSREGRRLDRLLLAGLLFGREVGDRELTPRRPRGLAINENGRGRRGALSLSELVVLFDVVVLFDGAGTVFLQTPRRIE